MVILRTLNEMNKLVLALLQIKGIGNSFIKKHIHLLYDDIDKAESNFIASDPRITKDAIDANKEYAEHIIHRCEILGINILPIYDSRYPKHLLELSDPPSILYTMGNLELLNTPQIAIIGTRNSTKLGESIAAKIGEYFSSNYCICNGLVAGVDNAAVSATNGNVVGVISCGLNYTLTASKITKHLVDQVLQNKGLVLSEYEPDQKEAQYSGSRSSRIQAGLSSALILVQSATTGGSKYTVKAFSGLNRVLGVIDFPSNEEYSSDESFSANRLICKEGMNGVAKFCEYKTLQKIKIDHIITIRSQANYREVENAIDKQRSKNISLF